MQAPRSAAFWGGHACLGFGSVYLGGHMSAGSCLDSRDRPETFVSDDWRKLAGDYRFGRPHHAAEDRRR
jgi:hypothetical protein